MPTSTGCLHSWQGSRTPTSGPLAVSGTSCCPRSGLRMGRDAAAATESPLHHEGCAPASRPSISSVRMWRGWRPTISRPARSHDRPFPSLSARMRRVMAGHHRKSARSLANSARHKSQAACRMPRSGGARGRPDPRPGRGGWDGGGRVRRRLRSRPAAQAARSAAAVAARRPKRLTRSARGIGRPYQ